MKEDIYTLPNQIRVIRKNCDAEVSCCGFAIAAGSRDEEEKEQGLAHFTEHLLFKGTRKRKAFHVLNRLNAVGGELNASTGKEDTFVYGLFLKNDFERALELLCDMLFYSTFPQREVEKEREVVLDEINSYEDSPSELIFDDFERCLFEHHPFGRNILGIPESLQTFESPDFRAFTRRCYTTDRLVFFSLSSLENKKTDALIQKYLAPIPDNSADSVFYQRSRPLRANAFKNHFPRNTHQTHVLYGNTAYSMYDEKRYALFLLNNLLGGPGMNSRLNTLLREHSGLVYTVESGLSFYTDTGLCSIYFGSDPKNTDRCLALIDKELKRLREQPLSSARLHFAKKQLFGQLSIAAENKESRALNMGKSLLYYNQYQPLGNFMAKIEAIDAMQLCEVASEVFNPKELSLLVYS
ncbi:MAG: pitrilysin family protein [Bacteroidales bacterium]|nr:pitrilysin family protein [Bacteroidales bacterium]MDD3430545.1 pitrilysin family protein [Bacteroidales bacterium]MDD4361463.1 pitrilysin family protein [Bacteroidales bacterium]